MAGDNISREAVAGMWRPSSSLLGDIHHYYTGWSYNNQAKSTFWMTALMSNKPDFAKTRVPRNHGTTRNVIILRRWLASRNFWPEVVIFYQCGQSIDIQGWYDRTSDIKISTAWLSVSRRRVPKPAYFNVCGASERAILKRFALVRIVAKDISLRQIRNFPT